MTVRLAVCSSTRVDVCANRRRFGCNLDVRALAARPSTTSQCCDWTTRPTAVSRKNAVPVLVDPPRGLVALDVDVEVIGVRRVVVWRQHRVEETAPGEIAHEVAEGDRSFRRIGN